MSGFLHFGQLGSDLYTLLSVVNAQEQNQLALSDERLQPNLAGPIYAEVLMEDLLISSAIRLRMLEERFTSKEALFNLVFEPIQICRLVGDDAVADKPQQSGLRFACNKIVHGRAFSFYINGRYDEVLIAGEERSRTWVVQIDLRKFAVEGMNLVAQYEDNWSVSGRDANYINFD